MKKLFRDFTLLSVLILLSCTGKTMSGQNANNNDGDSLKVKSNSEKEENKAPKEVDRDTYDSLLMHVANGDTTGLWPVENQPLPLQGAILPFKRIVAYYGNLYSKQMGILGEYPPEEMWSRLHKEVKAWEDADPKIPAIPALHYIAVVAQGNATRDGKWRLRMPDEQIDSVLSIAEMHDAIVFLDVQVGLSTVESEVPSLEKYLVMPHVHLGIDPEFSMKDGTPPGKKVGTFDAEDINFVTEYLAGIVRDNNLPSKVLVVHRFTRKMITNYKDIKLRPEVQIVINMDGFGRPELKYNTQEAFIKHEPVQFTGFKLFYKNDTKQSPNHLLTPAELMKLQPRPVYIQFQ